MRIAIAVALTLVSLLSGYFWLMCVFQVEASYWGAAFIFGILGALSSWAAFGLGKLYRDLIDYF